MEVTLGGLFVITLISGSLASAKTVPAKDLKLVTFQVLKKHPALRKCLEAVQKNDYVGMRVSELTGECQGLDRSWGLNQTIKSGYAYAKKQFVNETFGPPVGLDIKEVKRVIPGVLDTGARLDVFVTNPQREGEDQSGVVIILRDAFLREENSFRFIWYPRALFVAGIKQLAMGGIIQIKYKLPTHIKSKEVVKVSFLVQADAISILIEDEELRTIKPVADVSMLNEIKVQRAEEVLQVFGFVYSLHFTVK